MLSPGCGGDPFLEQCSEAHMASLDAAGHAGLQNRLALLGVGIGDDERKQRAALHECEGELVERRCVRARPGRLSRG